MMNGTENVKFYSVAYNDETNDHQRFGTIWIVETRSGSLGVEKKFLISSVIDHDLGIEETMIFPHDDTGEVLYLEVWSDHDFRSNASQHSIFLMEYLKTQRSISLSPKMTTSESIEKFGMDLC